MSKPTPEENLLEAIIERAVQEAVLIERERCAKVAEDMWHALHKDIAAAIRKDPS